MIRDEDFYQGYRPSCLVISLSILISLGVAIVAASWVVNLLWPPMALEHGVPESQLPDQRIGLVNIVGNSVLVLVWSLLLGVCSGAGQAIVQRHRWPNISFSSWLSSHVLGAMAGCSTFIIVVFVPTSLELPFWLLLLGVCLLFGCLVSGAQWLVLRRHLASSERWVGFNALLWSVSLGLGYSIVYAIGTMIEDARRPIM